MCWLWGCVCTSIVCLLSFVVFVSAHRGSRQKRWYFRAVSEGSACVNNKDCIVAATSFPFFPFTLGSPVLLVELHTHWEAPERGSFTTGKRSKDKYLVLIANCTFAPPPPSTGISSVTLWLAQRRRSPGDSLTLNEHIDALLPFTHLPVSLWLLVTGEEEAHSGVNTQNVAVQLFCPSHLPILLQISPHTHNAFGHFIDICPFLRFAIWYYTWLWNTDSNVLVVEPKALNQPSTGPVQKMYKPQQSLLIEEHMFLLSCVETPPCAA